MNTVDVIVVGGGIVGASVAWHLADTHRVCVIEQGPSPGQEATRQNAGLIRRMGAEPTERALARRTFQFLQNLGDDWSGLSPVQTTGAVVALGLDPLHLHDSVAHLRASGISVEDLERPQEVAAVLRNSPICRAWYLPEEQRVDAQALMKGFLHGLSRKGGALRCGLSVTGLEVSNGRVVGVQTPTGTIFSDSVVLAGGAWAQRLADSMGLSRPLIPLQRHVAILSGTSSPGPWVWIDDIGVYVRPDPSGWLVCACDETVVPIPQGSGSTGALPSAALALIRAKLRAFFPTIASLEVADGWSGLRTFAPDRRPVLGADPAVSGLWWAAGLGGGGVSGCVGVGQALGAWMTDQPTPWLDAKGIAPGRAMLSRWTIYPRGDLDSAALVSVEPA